jgi:hypothetical protein
MQAPAQEFLAHSRPMEFCPQSREPDKHSLAAEVLRNTGKLRLVARGHSMLPTLWPGDLLNIEATSVEWVRAGDLVLFSREDRFFVHRILGRNESTRPSLVTRGDSMPQADAPVFAEELLGRVVSFQRHRARSCGVPGCSRWRRCLGLVLAYSDRLRSVALRIHGWRAHNFEVNSELVAQQARLG